MESTCRSCSETYRRRRRSRHASAQRRGARANLRSHHAPPRRRWRFRTATNNRGDCTVCGSTDRARRRDRDRPRAWPRRCRRGRNAAIRDAFDAAKRQPQDHARRERVRNQTSRLGVRRARRPLLRDLGYGFIEPRRVARCTFTATACSTAASTVSPRACPFASSRSSARRGRRRLPCGRAAGARAPRVRPGRRDRPRARTRGDGRVYLLSRGFGTSACWLPCGRSPARPSSPASSQFAYEDAPLPIEAAQTISQPYIVAAMIARSARAADRVLEVGTGSGYAAAVLSRIAADVYTIERHEEPAVAAERRLHEPAIRNVHVRHGDGRWAGPSTRRSTRRGRGRRPRRARDPSSSSRSAAGS